MALRSKAFAPVKRADGEELNDEVAARKNLASSDKQLISRTRKKS
jgi:hypothetical protein